MPNIDLGKVVGEQGPEGPVAQGTMMEATYDPTGKAQDVFAYADTAKQEAKDYAAPKTHASQHGASGSDPVTPAAIGAYPNGIKGAVNCNNLSDGAWTISASASNSPGAFACTLFHKDWNVDFASQIAFGADRNVYYRVKTGGSWLAWQEMYSTLRYPSPSDIGAAASSHNHDDRYYKLSDVGIARIATGSYVGTGGYKESNPTTLSFDFVPKVVIFYQKDSGGVSATTSSRGGALLVNGVTKYYVSEYAGASSNTEYITITWNGNSVSWYGDDAGAQMNKSGIEYVYAAFG